MRRKKRNNTENKTEAPRRCNDSNANEKLGLNSFSISSSMAHTHDFYSLRVGYYVRWPQNAAAKFNIIFVSTLYFSYQTDIPLFFSFSLSRCLVDNRTMVPAYIRLSFYSKNSFAIVLTWMFALCWDIRKLIERFDYQWSMTLFD